MFLALLLIAAALAFLWFGGSTAYARWRQNHFADSDRGIRTTGECVNLRWTSGGLVSGGIRFADAGGRSHTAWTHVSRTIPVHVGRTVAACYDPQHKAAPDINGVTGASGSYRAGAAFIALGILLALQALDVLSG